MSAGWLAHLSASAFNQFTATVVRTVSMFVQLDADVGTSDEVQSRLTHVVVPCIAQLAAECHRDTSTLRRLNELVCYKTKPADCPPQVSYNSQMVLVRWSLWRLPPSLEKI